MMEIHRIKQILMRYLSGSSGSKEKEQVENWYRSFETGEPEKLSEEKETGLREEIWGRIKPEIDKRPPFLPLWLKVAALFILVPGICWILFKGNKGRIQDSRRAYTEITTRPGERRNVRMTDGSLLVLNGGSFVRVDNDLSEERNVEILDGEVYFDVKSDKKKPFIIKSGKLTTRVLGTEFSVSAYRGLSSMRVSVVGGKVSVSAGGRILNTLTRGRELVYNKKESAFTVGTLEPGVVSWKKGILNLNDVSFAEMSVLMEKNFGVRILTDNRYIRNTTRYTTALPSSMKPIEAVEVLAAIHKLKIRKDRNSFYFLSPSRK